MVKFGLIHKKSGSDVEIRHSKLNLMQNSNTTLRTPTLFTFDFMPSCLFI